jgi:arginase
MSNRKKILQFLGVPCGVGGRILGCENAPNFLRQAGFEKVFPKSLWNTEDAGDVEIPHMERASDKPGFHHKPEIKAWCEGAKKQVLSTLEQDKFPLILGGEHSIAIGSIAGVSEYCRTHGQELVVIWLDAHSDFNTLETSYSGNIHGMPLAVLLGDGDPELTAIVGKENYLVPQNIFQIGLRSVDAGERARLRNTHIHAFSMRDIDQLGIHTIMSGILNPLMGKKNIHLHLSFDVDFLDGDLAPAVGTREHGGPTFREARHCFELIAESGLLGSMDLVEYNPNLDIEHKTRDVLFNLVPFLFGKTLL